MAFADWKIKHPTSYNGAVVASITASDFKFRTRSTYGLSCFNDPDRGTLELNLGIHDIEHDMIQKVRDVEEWVIINVSKDPQFKEHLKDKTFNSSLKDTMLKTKVNMKSVNVWDEKGGELESNDLFGRELKLNVVIQPRRVYFMGKMYGIVWEVQDVQIYPKLKKCPFRLSDNP